MMYINWNLIYLYSYLLQEILFIKVFTFDSEEVMSIQKSLLDSRSIKSFFVIRKFVLHSSIFFKRKNGVINKIRKLNNSFYLNEGNQEILKSDLLLEVEILLKTLDFCFLENRHTFFSTIFQTNMFSIQKELDKVPYCKSLINKRDLFILAKVWENLFFTRVFGNNLNFFILSYEIKPSLADPRYDFWNLIITFLISSEILDEKCRLENNLSWNKKTIPYTLISNSLLSHILSSFTKFINSHSIDFRTPSNDSKSFLDVTAHKKKLRNALNKLKGATQEIVIFVLNKIIFDWAISKRIRVVCS